uniref:Exo70 domain-containing protein n=1 Tax=Macrostomum lignano TaxID=282301 RepID=A0A1I8F3N5_9PLAT
MEKNKPLSQQRMASEMPGKLSEKDKALIKEKFKSFNEEFQARPQDPGQLLGARSRTPTGSHSRENKAFLLDRYAMFRDKYANVPFTSKKDKYIKFTKDDVERMLDEFFRGV